MVPVETPKRSMAARLPVVKTVYCMSEAELVDVALGVLIESQKQEKALAEPPLAEADKPALFSPSCSASPSSPGSGSEDQDEGKGALPPRRSPQQPAGAGSSSGRSPEDEEEDVLKYVREIFFS